MTLYRAKNLVIHRDSKTGMPKVARFFLTEIPKMHPILQQNATDLFFNFQQNVTDLFYLCLNELIF